MKWRKERVLSFQLGDNAKSSEDETLRSSNVESVPDLASVESVCSESDHQARRAPVLLPKVALSSSPSTSKIYHFITFCLT